MASFKKDFLLPLVLLLIGIFLLLATLEVFPLRKCWPGIIIILGCVACIYYLIQENNDRKKQSPENISNILSDPEIEKIEQKLKDIEHKVFEGGKSELLRFIRRQGIFLSVVVTVIGFFGISSYVDKIFMDVKVESEIYKKSLEVYNTRLEKGLSELKIGMKKVTNFTEMVDKIVASTETNLTKLDSLTNQLNKNIAAIRDTTELAKRKLQKDMEWNEEKINNLSDLVKKLSSELQKVSQEKKKLEIAIDQFNERTDEIDSEQKQFKENINYTINVYYSTMNKDRALRYKNILESLGFNVIEQLLADLEAGIWEYFSRSVSYNGNNNVFDKANELVKIDEFRDFEVKKNNKQPISNYSLRLWIID